MGGARGHAVIPGTRRTGPQHQRRPVARAGGHRRGARGGRGDAARGGVAEWRAVGLVAAAVRSIAEAADALDTAGWLAHTTAPDGRRIRLPGPAAGPPPDALPFAPATGADTDAVLVRAGFAAAEVAALREAGVVA